MKPMKEWNLTAYTTHTSNNIYLSFLRWDRENTIAISGLASLCLSFSSPLHLLRSFRFSSRVRFLLQSVIESLSLRHHCNYCRRLSRLSTAITWSAYCWRPLPLLLFIRNSYEHLSFSQDCATYIQTLILYLRLLSSRATVNVNLCRQHKCKATTRFVCHWYECVYVWNDRTAIDFVSMLNRIRREDE